MLIATLAVVSGGGFAASDIDLDASFAEFVVQYHKPYASDPVEYARRKANFKVCVSVLEREKESDFLRLLFRSTIPPRHPSRATRPSMLSRLLEEGWPRMA